MEQKMQAYRNWFLSSMESILFEEIRECRLIKKISLPYGIDAALVKIDPPVIGQNVNRPEDVEYLILIPRFEGDSLFPSPRLPLFVHIALARLDIDAIGDRLNMDQLVRIAWGEIYQSREAAEKKFS